MEGRQPPLGVLGEDDAVSRRLRGSVDGAVRARSLTGLLAGPMLAALMLGGLLAGCTTDDDAPESGPTPTPTVVPTATPVPAPPVGACYRLTYEQAVAPTTDVAPVGCGRRHTSTTYAVGRVDALVDGHLLAIDSERVQAQVARTCPRRLGAFLGGSVEDLRLSMLRPVWFTPSVEESDAGADWFRCDVIALAGDGVLAPLDRRMRGVLGREEGRDRFAMCGTTAPDDPAFERVPCAADHGWRAVAVVDLPAGEYPGVAAVRQRGQQPCEDAGRDAADDPLDFEWGYEWPTAEQWAAGQTFGRCWAPD